MQKNDIKMFVFLIITHSFFFHSILACLCDDFLNIFLSPNFHVKTESTVIITLSTKEKTFLIFANLSNLKHLYQLKCL